VSQAAFGGIAFYTGTTHETASRAAQIMQAPPLNPTTFVKYALRITEVSERPPASAGKYKFRRSYPGELGDYGLGLG